ncbi:xaa-Arg dipeptidase-like [Ostrea edulis]|uniref:xaa-Arg dipeptidase-like n=1 Tax=Ostrea edulis TaxID=37623 RepID=UPI0024AFCF0D|nr:xaa-Arg dipeptidase-like [Ostrea edulis]
MENCKKTACDFIDKYASELQQLSKSIWETPELAYRERHAHDVITEFLDKHEFNVEKRYKLDTAFRAEFSKSDSREGPRVAVLCEYDALPGIGHACGHNLIAEVGVAAGIAIKHAMKSCGQTLAGQLSVIGTPAEEGRCGKHDLIAAGAFTSVDVAMMAHPSQYTLARPKYTSMIPVTIKFSGQAAHSASHPWEGLNALDAAVMCYNSISCLRQQMKPAWRIHGVIRKGGVEPNIIPDETELEFFLRTPSEAELEVLKKKVIDCINGAALCTGCEASYTFAEKHYQSLLSNNTMAELFEENGRQLGIEFDQREEIRIKFGGSTDMGNVSHVVPSLHPKFYIGTTVSNHSKGFTTAAGADVAQGYSLAVAKALAMTAIDILSKPELIPKIQQDFHKDLQSVS